MKVKIAYTVELDDVPTECMKIIAQKQTELSNVLSTLMDIKEENIVDSLGKIKQCRDRTAMPCCPNFKSPSHP